MHWTLSVWRASCSVAMARRGLGLGSKRCANAGGSIRIGFIRSSTTPPAKQNLQALIDWLPARLQREGRLAKQWRDGLWQGDLKALHRSLCDTLRGKKKAQALNKWDNYFARNPKRLQYSRFRERAVPCGSGCVESAIRRVINLRLKAPGTFWTLEMAECFLLLRSQLLSGRWDIFIDNVARLKTRLLEPLLQHTAPITESQAVEYLQAA